ncbi:nicotinamide-nucleotide amidohydrolase family protein [Parasphaerochaeta coccoides]|uniref:CinA-like protein n=1 Tax=Parasphaerochaeta coccoides (strain ATCC BAA-1237 / DSM 17374 / SPN1) TaxID=760011 RepID=F4GLQ2_PARC1|nr:nicotinamide-nucleotide amidohydrolase family protein [Parasphaerochaeta coccoides]AEC02446.1 CinA domain protein [Parasphaerochaeta coccoides DSM 17374]
MPEHEYHNATICIIGTEITRGIITDRHGQHLAAELTRLGYRVNRIVVLPDDGTIEGGLKANLDHSDVVLVTGGLGPTSDDMTRRVIADMAGVRLVTDPYAWQLVYERMGERIHGPNERQALIPEGFTVLENPRGTAPGFRGFIPISGENGVTRHVACAAMPGPPLELNGMFEDLVRPWLASLRGHHETSRDEYSVYLLGESVLEAKYAEAARDGVQWGTRFQPHRISLYVTGSSEDARRETMIRLRRILGTELVANGNMEAVDALSDLLLEKGMMLSCAESCTSGYLSKLLTDRAGSSAWFWGGMVTYADQSKICLLGVRKATLEKHGAVSGQCVAEMAEGMLHASGTSLAISISGIAGPDGGTEDKPVGEVWFGFASPEQKTEVVRLRFTTWGRDSIRRRAAVAACVLARAFLEKRPLLDITGAWLYI